MNLKLKSKHLYISIKAPLKRMWFALFKKELQIINVHIHAPVAIANSLNYIEWHTKHMSHCYIKTQTQTKLVSGSRYYFYNNEAHKQVTLLLMGYNTTKTFVYDLSYLSVNKKTLPNLEIVSKVKAIKNVQINVKNFKKLALPSLVLNSSVLLKSKSRVLESIETRSDSLNKKLTNQSHKI